MTVASMHMRDNQVKMRKKMRRKAMMMKKRLRRRRRTKMKRMTAVMSMMDNFMSGNAVHFNAAIYFVCPAQTL